MLNIFAKTTLFKKMEGGVRTRIGIFAHEKLQGLFVGGEGREILRVNERQIAFMSLTGLALVYMNYTKGVNMLSAVYLLIATIGCSISINTIVHQPDANGIFAVVKRDFDIKKVFDNDILDDLGLVIQTLVMFFGLNYIAARGFSYIVSDMVASEISKAAGFVMASLVIIYPSTCYNKNNTEINVSTISGFVGVASFGICATAIHIARLNSSAKAMLALKVMPIFLACAESIYQECYGVDKSKNAPKSTSTVSCVLGSAILTTGFIGGDYLTQIVALSSVSNVRKIAAEIALTPIIVIIASFVCRGFCNTVGVSNKVQVQSH